MISAMYEELSPNFRSRWTDELGSSYQEYLLKKAAKDEPPMYEIEWRACVRVFTGKAPMR